MNSANYVIPICNTVNLAFINGSSVWTVYEQCSSERFTNYVNANLRQSQLRIIIFSLLIQENKK